MNVTALIVVVPLLLCAWVIDIWLWRRKSRDKLVGMLKSDDWRSYKPAVLELRRRGDDVTIYLPRIVAMLVSNSKIERAAAKAIIKSCFPDLAGDVADYSATADIETCRGKAASLLSRFPVIS